MYISFPNFVHINIWKKSQKKDFQVYVFFYRFCGYIFYKPSRDHPRLLGV